MLTDMTHRTSEDDPAPKGVRVRARTVKLSVRAHAHKTYAAYTVRGARAWERTPLLHVGVGSGNETMIKQQEQSDGV